MEVAMIAKTISPKALMTIIMRVACILLFLLLSTSVYAAKENFDRSKPHLNIAVLGHYHGDAAGLLRQMSEVLDSRVKRDDVTYLDEGDEFSPGTGFFGMPRYLTKVRQHRRRDEIFHMSGADTLKNLSTGSTSVDGVILVVSASDGPMPQTREHILLARQVGIPSVTVYMNLAGLEKKGRGHIRRAEKATRALLTEVGYDGAAIPVIVGGTDKCQNERLGDLSADCEEEIIALNKAVVESTPLPPRDVDKDFLMAVEGVLSLDGRGTVVTGMIETGTIKVKDAVDIVGFSSNPVRTEIEEIFSLDVSVPQGEAGDEVGLVLRGIEKSDIRRGMVIAKPDSIQASSLFKAALYILEEEEGGRQKPFINKFRPSFYLRTTDITGEITLESGREMVMPGDNVQIDVQLVEPMPIGQGLRFAIREGGRTVGAGVVTKIVD